MNTSRGLGGWCSAGNRTHSCTQIGNTTQEHTSHRIYHQRFYFVVLNKFPFLIPAILLNQTITPRYEVGQCSHPSLNCEGRGRGSSAQTQDCTQSKTFVAALLISTGARMDVLWSQIWGCNNQRIEVVIVQIYVMS